MPSAVPLRVRFGLLLAILCAGAFGSTHLSAALLRTSPYLTRAEAVAIIMLARPEAIPKAPTTISYTDVLSTDWFAAPMLAAAKLKIIAPDVSGTQLKPFGSVNRATFLKILTLAFGLSVNQPQSYTDVPTYAWYAPYAGTENVYRLFTHADPKRLEPDRLVTQDEARTALQVFLQLRSKAQEEEQRAALYTVISTKRLKVVLVPDTQKRLTSVQEKSPPPETQTVQPVSSSSRSSLSPVASAPRKTTEDIRNEVLALTNAARMKAGLPALTRSTALEQSAQAYADEMNSEGFFGHTDPEGKSLKDRIDAVHYYQTSYSAACQCINGYTLGENLARGQRSAAEVVQAWMDSPSHREVLLGNDFTDIGIGIQSGVWVEHLGGILVPEK